MLVKSNVFKTFDEIFFKVVVLFIDSRSFIGEPVITFQKRFLCNVPSGLFTLTTVQKISVSSKILQLMFLIYCLLLAIEPKSQLESDFYLI